MPVGVPVRIEWRLPDEGVNVVVVHAVLAHEELEGLVRGAQQEVW